jgi:hypothetical protein
VPERELCPRLRSLLHLSRWAEHWPCQGGGTSANAKLCQQGGWATLMDSTAIPFGSQGECVSYGAQAG